MAFLSVAMESTQQVVGLPQAPQTVRMPAGYAPEFRAARPPFGRHQRYRSSLRAAHSRCDELNRAPGRGAARRSWGTVHL